MYPHKLCVSRPNENRRILYLFWVSWLLRNTPLLYAKRAIKSRTSRTPSYAPVWHANHNRRARRDCQVHCARGFNHCNQPRSLCQREPLVRWCDADGRDWSTPNALARYIDDGGRVDDGRLTAAWRRGRGAQDDDAKTNAIRTDKKRCAGCTGRSFRFIKALSAGMARGSPSRPARRPQHAQGIIRGRIGRPLIYVRQSRAEFWVLCNLLRGNKNSRP